MAERWLIAYHFLSRECRTQRKVKDTMNRLLTAVVSLLVLAGVVGCESSSDGGSSNAGSGNTLPVATVRNVAGTWQLTDLTYGKNATIVLTQEGQG